MHQDELIRRQEERRRAARISLRVPLMIEGTDLEGLPFREHTETENVSIHGACIRTGHRVANGSQLKLTALRFNFSATAIVRLVWVDEVDGVLKMGVEFLETDNNWILR